MTGAPFMVDAAAADFRLKLWDAGSQKEVEVPGWPDLVPSGHKVSQPW